MANFNFKCPLCEEMGHKNHWERLPVCNKCKAEGKRVTWICTKCAYENGATWEDGHLATFHDDTCDVCRKVKAVTEPRDFLWPKKYR